MESHSTTTTERIDASQYGAHSGDTMSYAGNGQSDATHTTTTNTYVAGTSSPTYATFSPRRVTCPALNLSTKGATVGVETMQTGSIEVDVWRRQGTAHAAGHSHAWHLCRVDWIQCAVLPGVGCAWLWTRRGASVPV